MNIAVKDFGGHYITLLQGNTYAVREWLKEHGAKYNKIYNWYFPYQVEVPNPLPTEVTPVKFDIINILIDTDTYINDSDWLQMIVDKFRYPASPSEWVGVIGEADNFTLKYKNSRSICSQFGVTNIYNFEDKSGNVIKSMTARALPVEEDKWYTMTARIKEHKIFRNEKQTMIFYIKNIKPVEDDVV